VDGAEFVTDGRTNPSNVNNCRKERTQDGIWLVDHVTSPTDNVVEQMRSVGVDVMPRMANNLHHKHDTVLSHGIQGSSQN